ncbi:MAG: LEA type 2 family protein [Flavobacteriales bacterium]|nr:LEA type 2 family protein [Flavobacteriales bacterium]
MTVLLVSGCEFKDVELDRVDRFEINRFEEGKLDATLTLVLTNPNSFPITVKSGEFQIYSGKMHLGDAHLAKSFKINANSTEDYEVDVKGTVGDAIAAGLSGLASLLTGKKPEMIIKGELKAGNFFYSKKVPIELKTDMPLSL